MRFMGDDTVVITRGMAERAALTIDANAKAFKTLIDTLYSLKIESPMRELMSNAYDSHVAAGKADIPFEVTLPTKMNPKFVVKDYGVGMTHDFVMGPFSRLYFSTKDGMIAEENAKVDPDSQTGTLGLGSKSFFAYTDAATMTCTDGKEKRIYSLHMASGRVPDIAPMACLPCSEPTSVTMSFSVRTEDIDRFAEIFQRVMLGYDLTPNIMPYTRMEQYFEAMEKIARETILPGIARLEKKRFEDVPLLQKYNGIMIRQGSVVYPLPNEAKNDPRINSLFSLFKIANSSKKELYIVTLPIGSVSFTPSREALEETQENIDRIAQSLAGLSDVIKKEIVEDVKKFPTIQQQILYIKNRFRSNSDIYALLGLKEQEEYMGEIELFVNSPMFNADLRLNSKRKDLLDKKPVFQMVDQNSISNLIYDPGSFLLKAPYIIINDKYDTLGLNFHSHVRQIIISKETYYRDFRADHNKDFYDSDWQIHNMCFTSVLKTFVFSNVDEKQLKELFPATEIVKLSQVKFVRTRSKTIIGKDSSGNDLHSSADATGKFVLIEYSEGYEVEENETRYSVKDVHGLDRFLLEHGIPYLRVKSRYVKKIKNLDQSITKSMLFKLLLPRISKTMILDYAVARNIANCYELEDIDVSKLFLNSQYLTKGIIDRIIPKAHKQARAVFKKSGFRELNKKSPKLLDQYLKLFNSMEYERSVIENMARSHGAFVIPTNCAKDSFRHCELVYMKFLSSCIGILESAKKLSTIGNSDGYRNPYKKTKPKDLKYLRPIFSTVEGYVLEKKEELERKTSC